MFTWSEEAYFCAFFFIIQKVEMNREYFEFKLHDDDGRFFCRSFDTMSHPGFTHLEHIEYIPSGKTAYERETRGSQLIPNEKIESINTTKVVLSER